MASLSVRRLAEMAGVSNPYLSQIERGLRKPSAEIESILGYVDQPELIHRDNLVLLG